MTISGEIIECDGENELHVTVHNGDKILMIVVHADSDCFASLFDAKNRDCEYSNQTKIKDALKLLPNRKRND